MRFDSIRPPLTWRQIADNRVAQAKRERQWPATSERVTEPKPLGKTRRHV